MTPDGYVSQYTEHVKETKQKKNMQHYAAESVRNKKGSSWTLDIRFHSTFIKTASRSRHLKFPQVRPPENSYTLRRMTVYKNITYYTAKSLNMTAYDGG